MARKTKEKIPAGISTEVVVGENSLSDKSLSSNSMPTTSKVLGKPESDIFNSGGELVVDVFETNSDFVVLSAIAGVQIKDLDISVEKDMMVIKGQRQDPHGEAEKKYFYQECYWGPFSKKIVLPENIDVEKADAQMDKGLLVIKIPKLEDKKESVKLS